MIGWTNKQTFWYDFSGKRVKKQSGSTTTVYIYTGPKVIAEYDNGAAPSSPSREYIYSGRGVLAKIEGGVTTYFHNDHLSNRLLTDSNGNTAAQQGHYPFGEQWYPVPPASPATKWEFTTYERDSESTNDYALARSFVNRFGRFSSPDPLSGGLDDPQSLNRYAYAHNDPCNRVDPLGLDTCTFNIKINNDTLSIKDLNNVLFQIAAIFGQGTDLNGNSVAVNFVFGGNADYPNADYTLNVTNDSWYNPFTTKDTGGITYFPGIATVSNLLVNNALNGTNLTSSQADRYLGSIGAHELIQHAILGHYGHEDDPKNIGAQGNASPTPPGKGNAELTPQQIAQMYKDCITKHPPKDASGKGNGGGGGGGAASSGNGNGNGAGSGQNCWTSLQPTPGGLPSVTVCDIGGGGVSVTGPLGTLCYDASENIIPCPHSSENLPQRPLMEPLIPTHRHSTPLSIPGRGPVEIVARANLRFADGCRAELWYKRRYTQWLSRSS